MSKNAIFRLFSVLCFALVLVFGLCLCPLRADALAYPLFYSVVTTYMAASGYTVHGYGDSDQFAEVVEDLWGQYVSATAGAWDIPQMSAGCRLLATGRFWVGPGALDNLAAFISWLESSKGAVAGTTTQLVVPGQQFYFRFEDGRFIPCSYLLDPPSGGHTGNVGPQDPTIIIVVGGTTEKTIAFGPGRYVRFWFQGTGSTRQIHFESYVGNQLDKSYSSNSSKGSMVSLGAVVTLSWANGDSVEPQIAWPYTSDSGNYGSWYIGTKLFTDGYTLPLYGTTTGGVTVAAGAVIDAPTTEDEDQALVIGVPGLTDNSASGAWDTVTDRANDNTLSKDTVTTQVVDNTQAGDVSGENAGVGEYEVPFLEDVFPFCLPWDVYHFFQAFNASPTAPHFEWRMYVPNLVDYTFVIDLSQFDDIARICRILEFAAFCVGLAILTRQWLRG